MHKPKDSSLGTNGITSNKLKLLVSNTPSTDAIIGEMIFNNSFDCCQSVLRIICSQLRIYFIISLFLIVDSAYPAFLLYALSCTKNSTLMQKNS